MTLVLLLLFRGESKITFIDGKKGILRYRGYDIEDLAHKSDFIEVVNLLIYGDLPNRDQLRKYKKLISRHTLLHEQIINFFKDLDVMHIQWP